MHQVSGVCRVILKHHRAAITMGSGPAKGEEHGRKFGRVVGEALRAQETRM